MRKTKKIKVTETKEVTTDIVCNNCGGSCQVGSFDSKGKDKVYEGLLETEVHGGFFSSELGDMTSYRFSLCEKCLSKMFSGFKVPVEIKDECTCHDPFKDL